MEMNHGAFSAGQRVYLYVVRSDGSVSGGLPVTLDLVPLWWYPDVNQTPRLEDEDSDAVLYIPRLDCNKLAIGKALSRIRRSREEPSP